MFYIFLFSLNLTISRIFVTVQKTERDYLISLSSEAFFYRKLNRFKNNARQKIRISDLRNWTFFKHLLLYQQEASRVLSLRSLMPFMILEIITRIANVNSIREQNEKIWSLKARKRVVWSRKNFTDWQLMKHSYLEHRKKKSVQDFAELFWWKFGDWAITGRERKKINKK